MRERDSNKISVGDLLDDPLLHRYFPKGIDQRMIKRQLQDQMLVQGKMEELLSMNEEELATHLFTQGLAFEETSLAPPRSEEEIPTLPQTVEQQQEEEDAALVRSLFATKPPEEQVSVLVEGLGIEAKVVLHRVEGETSAPGLSQIEETLARNGVVEGIRQDFIERLADRPIYDRPFKIAMGKLPVNGEDGQAIFHFDVETNLTPKILADGSADYKSLDYAKSVQAGEILCELIPPTPGEDGISVYGEVLPGRAGIASDILCGSNTSLSEDQRYILAACDGQVYLRDKKITVSRVLVVDQVDASTGNILFVGTVEVRGDVLGGFTVRAGGDIMVKGIVEDATLVAGGNIILCSGMKGRDTGLLDAGGNIRTLFLENAQVRAKQNIYADVILNSQVECGLTVNLSGMNGCLLGGKCTAGRGGQRAAHRQ